MDPRERGRVERVVVMRVADKDGIDLPDPLRPEPLLDLAFIWTDPSDERFDGAWPGHKPIHQ